MSTDNQPAEGGSEDLRAVVTSYGHRRAPANEVSPELQPYLEQVRAMDSIRDVRGNVNSTLSSGLPKMKATALSPEKKSEIYRKLDSMPNMSAEDRAEREEKLAREAATAQLGAIRGKVGVHPNSLPFHKEQAQIAMDVQSFYDKRDVLQKGIDKVVDVRKVEDPTTGEVSAEPIYWLSDHTRQKWQEAIDGLDRDIRLLVKEDGSHGIIGARRLAHAEIASAKILQKQADMFAREQEAQELAAKMVREEQVAERAEILARMKRSDRT